MEILGMSEAAKLAGYGSTNAVRLALSRAGVELIKVGNSLGVERGALEAFIALGRPVRRGRPSKGGDRSG